MLGRTPVCHRPRQIERAGNVQADGVDRVGHSTTHHHLPVRFDHQIGFLAVALLLLVSLPSFRLIPFHTFRGLDFQNLYAFHHCDARNNPYLVSGATCGDTLGRGMNYPPLLYFSFFWVRWISFTGGVRLWSVVILLGVVVSTFAWTPPEEPVTQASSMPPIRRLRMPQPGTLAFVLLLALQFPVAFSIERGNSDVLILALWTAAFLLYARGRTGAAGVAGGAAVATKLYPVFAFLIVVSGLVGAARRDGRGWKDVATFAGAGLMAVAAATVMFLPQTSDYVNHVLPVFSRTETGLRVYSHSLRYVAPSRSWVFPVLAGGLLLVWSIAGWQLVRRDSAMVFAGGLAIATYFARTSYDYNLITTFPLLIVLFGHARADETARFRPALLLLLLGLLGVIGHRRLFAGSTAMLRTHVLIQWVWLMAVGGFAATLPRRIGIHQAEPVAANRRGFRPEPRCQRPGGGVRHLLQFSAHDQLA